MASESAEYGASTKKTDHSDSKALSPTRSKLRFNLSLSKGKKKAKNNNKTEIPITDQEGQLLVDKIQRRLERNNNKNNRFLQGARPNQAARVIDAHEKNLKLWNRINKFLCNKRSKTNKRISAKPERSLLIGNPKFIKKLQRDHNYELSKTFAERNGSSSWAFTLRNSHNHQN